MSFSPSSPSPSSFRFVHPPSSFFISPLLVLLLLLSSSSSSLALAHDETNQSSNAYLANFDATWRVFGPLTPGTLSARQAADPLSLLPNSFFSALDKLDRYPSEVAISRNSYATWTTIKSTPMSKHPYRQATLNFSTVHDGYSNNNNTNSLEYNAWARGTLVLENPPIDAGKKSTFVMAACSHAAYITPRTPALHRQQHARRHHCQADYVPCPLSLSSQEYAVHMAISNSDLHFGCIIIPDIKAPTLVPFHAESVRPSVILHSPSIGNPIPLAALAGSHASISVLNADEQEWATAGSITVTSVPPGIQLAELSPHPPRLAPGQMRAVRIDLDMATDMDATLLAGVKYLNVSIELQYTVNGNTRHAQYSLALDILVWPPTQYTATYIDNDGSVRAVALRPPAQTCSSAGCAVLLSADGDTDKMDRYGAQKDAWVISLGNNNRNKKDGALKCLDEVREELPGVPEKLKGQYAIRRDWTLVSASNVDRTGRNEALDLLKHYPDLFLAAIAISPRRHQYQYSRTQLRNGNHGYIYSSQLEGADAGLRALFDSDKYAANEGHFSYAENVVGVPIAALQDESRTMGNLEKTFCGAVRAHEIFLGLNTSMVSDEKQVPTRKNGHSKLQPFLKKSFSANTKHLLPLRFSLVTVNPAETGSRGGLQIMALIVPFQTARIHVMRRNTADSSSTPDKTPWVITTRNVKRLRFRAVNGVYPRPSKLAIDDTAEISMPSSIRDYNGTSEAFLDVCGGDTTTGVSWEICTSTTNTQETQETSDIDTHRSIDTAGPLTQILGARRIAVVYPPQRQDLLELGTRYANALHKIGMAASVTADTAAVRLLEQGAHNVVVLGGSSVNEAAKVLEKQKNVAGTTVSTSSKANKGVQNGVIEICVGDRCTHKKRTGVLYLTPGRFSTLGIVVAGTDDHGLKAAAAFLPVNPQQKLPEWVLVNARDGQRTGMGRDMDIGIDIEAAGYWNNEWRFEDALSHPPYWTATTAPRRNSMVVVHAENGNNSRRIKRYTLGILASAALFVLGWIIVRRWKWYKSCTGRNPGYQRFPFMLDELEGAQRA